MLLPVPELDASLVTPLFPDLGCSDELGSTSAEPEGTGCGLVVSDVPVGVADVGFTGDAPGTESELTHQVAMQIKSSSHPA